ncbi:MULTISPECIES: M48 family metallopeptidase [unclassified Candidatus Accumulibacter]|uniref:M48 metallopeptidase family protein n=1 Tax=unclassified Candidatus Accumulibacter TaxID=2619054 RepID=UPI0025BC7545|nr:MULTISPECIES: M48 family metallopeptidase [unclassified Candidatus Accumulibacter]
MGGRCRSASGKRTRRCTCEVPTGGEPVTLPHQVEQFLHYFCGDAASANALTKTEAIVIFNHLPDILGVKASGYFLQRMKTKWGSCNHRAGSIRLNSELVKKPRDLLEYVVVHEMLHLVEPTHSERFVALLDQHFPTWREARAELNVLPLAAETWNQSVGDVARD